MGHSCDVNVTVSHQAVLLCVRVFRHHAACRARSLHQTSRMLRMPVTHDSDDPDWARIEAVFETVSGHWAIPVLRRMAQGITRRADILRAVNRDGYEPPLSGPVMAGVLSRLMAAGLVHRTERPGKPAPEAHYWLTLSGHRLVDEITQIRGPAPRPAPGHGRHMDNTSHATPAGIWDVWIGGDSHTQADTQAAAEAAEAEPSMPMVARATRRVQVDIVGDCIQRGVRQFLDIGAGYPTSGSVHQIAQMRQPESRVVYVDNDPDVLAQARDLLTSGVSGAVDYISADLRDTGTILREAARTLDLSAPVAVLLIGVLHFIPDAEDPWGVVDRLLAGVHADAYLAIVHGASDIRSEEGSEATRRYNQRSTVRYHPRPQAEVSRFFAAAEMLAGVVPLKDWRGPDAAVADLPAYAGLGVRRTGR
jgi:DNA-binding HxlR family transcriptional regulator/O-methyltransferase involved in polyketide biosynthesis